MAGCCQPLQLGEGEWQQTQTREWLASQLVSVLMEYGCLGLLSTTLLIVKGFLSPTAASTNSYPPCDLCMIYIVPLREQPAKGEDWGPRRRWQSRQPGIFELFCVAWELAQTQARVT